MLGITKGTYFFLPFLQIMFVCEPSGRPYTIHAALHRRPRTPNHSNPHHPLRGERYPHLLRNLISHALSLHGGWHLERTGQIILHRQRPPPAVQVCVAKRTSILFVSSILSYSSLKSNSGLIWIYKRNYRSCYRLDGSHGFSQHSWDDEAYPRVDVLRSSERDGMPRIPCNPPRTHHRTTSKQHSDVIRFSCGHQQPPSSSSFKFPCP